MPHRAYFRALVVFALSSFACASALAQGPQQREAPASLSGRVRLGERGAAGVSVMLMPSEPAASGFRVSARAKTDAEGRYRVTGLAPGSYRVFPSAPAHVLREATTRGEAGLLVMLAPGESVEDVDFSLVRGGVITGRVTDADGKPVVGEIVRLTYVDEAVPVGRPPIGSTLRQTDDRGVYRIYGLPAGRYKVSVGVDPDASFTAIGGPRRGNYVRTFHPDAADAASAKVVEVSEGGEATDVDITVGKLVKSFKAAGRVVNASTGQPVGGVTFAFSIIQPRGRMLMGAGLRAQANARGEFQLDGLLPGSYGVYVVSEGASDTYSDLTVFDIKDADVTGLEVKLRPGASVSGVVAVEGVSDPARAAQLFRGLTLAVYGNQREGPVAPRLGRVQVNPDGTFNATGLRPGKNLFSMSYVRGLTFLRTELNGAEQRGGIEVAEGSHVTGVRLVFAYGTGRVRGQVVLRENGQPVALPEGTRLDLSRRIGGGGQLSYSFGGEVDSRGRFVLENLPPGEVEVVVNALGRYRGRASQLVLVPDGGEAGVTLTLELTQGQPTRPRPQ